MKFTSVAGIGQGILVNEFYIVLTEGPDTFALTVTAGAGGSASDETGTSPYAESAVVDILATPDSSFNFVNWTTSDGGSFDSATTADTNYNMPANPAEVTANFAVIETEAVTSKGSKMIKIGML